jgi:signal transduction histidine kinase
MIRVTDSGVGIPPHAINYIFDEFRQVDGSSKRVYGGTGLGLAIVRNLCLMMKGNVKVTSELNKGSVFTVTLPCITPEKTQAALVS